MVVFAKMVNSLIFWLEFSVWYGKLCTSFFLIFVAQKALKVSEESYAETLKHKEEAETKTLELQSSQQVNESLKNEVNSTIKLMLNKAMIKKSLYSSQSGGFSYVTVIVTW